MIIKFITSFNPSANGIDACRIFTEVSDVVVTEEWVDLSRPKKLSDEELNEALSYDSYQDIRRSDDTSTTDQHQQKIKVVFTARNEKWTLVRTEMPVYIMNDNGKTIQAYHPLRK